MSFEVLGSVVGPEYMENDTLFARSLHFRRGASWELVIIVWCDIWQVCAQVPVNEESTEEGLLTQTWILGCGGCSGILVSYSS